MYSQNVCDVSDRPWYVFKKHLFVSLLEDPLGAFLQVLENVLQVEVVKSYIHCKIESIGDDDMHQDLGKNCKNDLTLKSKYAHLGSTIMIGPE